MFERQIKGQAVTGFCRLQFFKSVERKVFSKISQNFTSWNSRNIFISSSLYFSS